MISDLSARARLGANGVESILSWTTDELTKGQVDYGESAAYEMGPVVISQTSVKHNVILTGLSEAVLYHYQVTATDVNGNSTTKKASITPIIPVPNNALSDGFNTTTLDATQWLYLNPLNDGSMRLTGSQLELHVPAGEHYFGSSNDTVRVMQPIIDEDFVIEAKFDSLPTQRFQMQGILVEENANTSLRFEIYSDGNQLKLYAGNYRNGSSTHLYNERLIANNPVYLRVERLGQQWVVSTSSDGIDWQTAASFAHTMAVSEVGVYAGNTGSNSSAYTALIDNIKVFAASTPTPRIPPPLDIQAPLIIDIVASVQTDGNGVEVTVNWKTNEFAAGRVAYGETLNYEIGSTAVGSGGTEHSVTLTGLIENTLYNYQVIATDSSGNSSSESLSITTTILNSNAGLSDDFNVTKLDATQWLYIDPLDDGSMSFTGSQLVLNVVAGEHYFGSSNDTVRVMQPMVDENFVMKVKFDSLPTEKYQVQGILVEENASTSLRFEVYSDGSRLYLLVGSYRNGSTTNLYNELLTASTPQYLGVERMGQQWTVATSFDGVVWQTAFNFTHTLVTNEVGVYAGNTGSTPPAYTALIDDITLYAVGTPPPRVPPPADTLAPVISNIISSVQAGSDGAEVVVSWMTNERTTGSVAYGESTSYEVGSVATNQSVTAHSVVLTGLTEGTLYYYQVIATDSNGNSSAKDLSVVVTLEVPNDNLSDDLNATTLDGTQWLYVNPLNDGSMSLTGSQLELNVPAGKHYFGSSNDTVRVMQPIIDEDFVMEVKFDSLPTQRFQMQGILAEENANSSLRFEIYSDGSQLKLYVGRYLNGSSTHLHNEPMPASNPVYLRVKRLGQQWTVSTSPDGMVWQIGYSVVQALVANEVGVYAGNTGSPSPAYTALIDDIKVVAATTPTPRVPLPQDTTERAPEIDQVRTSVQSVNGRIELTLSWTTDMPSIGRVVYGESTSYEVGYIEIDQSAIEQKVTLTGLIEDTLYHYQVTATGSNGASNRTENLSVTTVVPVANENLSDDFNVATGLNFTQWLYVDPLAEGSMSLTGSQLALDVPAGEHYFGSSNDTVRVMQPIIDEDFVMEVKFDSLPTQRFQMQGILVEENANSSLRFETYSDGSQLKLYVGRYLNGSSMHLHNEPMTASNPVYLRVERLGQQWTVSTSSDGMVWQTGYSVVQALVVNEVGVYAGNTGSASPAYTALIDDIAVYAASTPTSRPPPPPDTVAPVISEVSSNVYAAADGVNVVIKWRTNESATGSVAYGEYTDYEAGSVATGKSTTKHNLTLSGLIEDVLYHYQLTVTDSSGNSSTAEFSVMASVPVPNSGLSDNFDATTLRMPQWLYVDPLNVGSMNLTGSQLALSVPAGEHYFGSRNNTVRVMQLMVDEGFTMEVKFDSLPTEQYQVQGIIIKQNSTAASLRFEIYSDGSKLNLYAGFYQDGSSVSLYNKPLAGSLSPRYLRVEREAQQWTASISSDGVIWKVITGFAYTLAANEVGVYVGNTGSSPPAYTALIDEIKLYAASTPLPDNSAPIISNIKSTIFGTSLELTWDTDELTVGAAQYGRTQAYDLGVVDSQYGAYNSHRVVIGGLEANTSYNVQVNSTDRALHMTSSQNYVVTTGGMVSDGPIIDIWDGTDQTFGALGTPQRWMNILGNVRALNGVVSLTYSLNGATEKLLTIGPNATRLASKGDFNVDIAIADLIEGGENTVVVTSTDTLGFTNTQSMTLNYQSNNVWPTTYTIDWSSVSAISDVAKAVDGLWQLDNDSVRTVEPGYDRLIAIGDVAWRDYEVTVPITVYGFTEDGYDSPSNGPGIGLGMRWPGHTDWGVAQPNMGWHELGAIGWYRWPCTDRLMLSGAAGAKSSAKPFDFRLNVTYMFKMRVETIPDYGQRYQLKVWEMGQSEPATWNLTLQEPLDSPLSGSLLFIAHEVDARFGNVSIVPLE